jgi:tRNA dimethylallyltransferase
MTKSKYLIIIVGPTASGKTGLAIQVARELDTEIINADSRQVYREMVIGTAVPNAYQQSQVKHHLIGHKSVTETYNASIFESEVLDLLNTLFLKHRVVIMTGGSGLYIDAVCKGIDDLPSVDPAVRERQRELYRINGIEGIKNKLKHVDPEYYKRADLKNSKRILKALEVYEMTGRPYSSYLTGMKKLRQFSTIKIGLDVDRKTLYDRINKRVDEMISNGLVEEVRSLCPHKDLNALNTVGYKEIFAYLDDRCSLGEAVDLIKRHTRQYARRQLTWFCKDQEIKWFSPDNTAEIFNYISMTPDNGIIN